MAVHHRVGAWASFAGNRRGHRRWCRWNNPIGDQQTLLKRLPVAKSIVGDLQPVDVDELTASDLGRESGDRNAAAARRCARRTERSANTMVQLESRREQSPGRRCCCRLQRRRAG